MVENNKSKLIPVWEKPFVSVKPKQLVKTIIRESDVDIVPPMSGNIEVETGIKRVWATLWGWCGDRLKRVRVDHLGRVSAVDFFVPCDVVELHTTMIDSPGFNATFTLSKACHRIQIFADNEILIASFGLSLGDYPHALVCTPHHETGVGKQPGSLGLYNGLAKIVVVTGTIHIQSSSVTVIGHSC